jgi:hypothetical protein
MSATSETDGTGWPGPPDGLYGLDEVHDRHAEGLFERL